MRVTSRKSRVRESRMPGSVRAEPYGRATRPRSNLSVGTSSPRRQNEGLRTRSDYRSRLHHPVKTGARDVVKSLPTIP